VRYFPDLLAQIGFDWPVNDRDEQNQARSFGSDAATQAEDHQALVLVDDADGVEQENHHHHDNESDDAK
jgi:hypothetical protein